MAEKKKLNVKPKASKSNVIMYVVLAIIVIIGVAYITYVFKQNNSNQFSSFKSSFISAKNVSIFVMDTNTTNFPAEIQCSTAFIERLLSNPATHRPSSSIGYFVINQTSCVYDNGIGSSANALYTNSSYCLNYSKIRPSIFFNYSSINQTTIINHNLYVSGNSKYLVECGISSEFN